MDRRPRQDVQPREPRHAGHHRGRPHSHDFFGLDVGKMSPEACVAVGAVVIVPIVVASILLLTLFEEMSWLIFVFGWAIFPAFGLFIRGIAGVVDGEKDLPSGNGRERELLGALRERGELTPAGAAMETSLTVAEAGAMLGAWPRGAPRGQGARRVPLLCSLGDPGRRSRARREGLIGATHVACVV
ncbi:hypothetical protein GBA65_19005 [Rubrobacter marinus]|uniref:Uncharacterized protein n=1 Tax=Rubrobacter marinus TaxID=2653852 RepID=A0A6G8Q1B8_9ACTN|nr:hypothetical protein [Rubrobacter marinus]QIN80261.1 hypothetical protein GBA65_19005 [Rubrobacter marinus]